MCYFSELLLLKFKSKQAGLLMYSKEFEKFVYEVESKVLEMPHFYLGKHHFVIKLIIYESFFKHIFFLAAE